MRYTGLRPPHIEIGFLLGFAIFGSLPKDNGLRKVIEYYFKQAINGESIEIIIASLIMDLELIKEKCEKDFKKFKEKLLHCDEGNFYGIRCEIAVNSLLLRRGISFIQRESPDFQCINDENIHIECTSSHLIDGSENSEKVFRKIKKSVRDKNGKIYASLKIILFIDLTNLNYSNNNHLFSDPQFDTEISKILSRTKYGALLFNINSLFNDGNDIVQRSNCHVSPAKHIDDNFTNILKLLCKETIFDTHKGISSKFP
ncbi:MAG: hypothetical protein HRU07_06640 [Nitrosopumilus sp.]|nr:hypothetical protein [Nitrosopumilus sp.]NRA05818.1 hypothetical protein [Nitrosopumilus sp.]